VLRHELLLLGVPILWRTVDREEIPLHVVLLRACVGDTGGWQSKYQPFDKKGVLTHEWKPANRGQASFEKRRER